jgi:hypothetical protein
MSKWGTSVTALILGGALAATTALPAQAMPISMPVEWLMGHGGGDMPVGAGGGGANTGGNYGGNSWAPPLGGWGPVAQGNVAQLGGDRVVYNWSVAGEGMMQVQVRAFDAAGNPYWVDAGIGRGGRVTVPWHDSAATPAVRSRSYSGHGGTVKF